MNVSQHAGELSIERLRRLRPSDVVRLRALIIVEGGLPKVLGIFLRYAIQLRQPSAVETDELRRIVRQLQQAGFWSSETINIVIDYAGKYLDREVVDALTGLLRTPESSTVFSAPVAALQTAVDLAIGSILDSQQWRLPEGRDRPPADQARMPIRISQLTLPRIQELRRIPDVVSKSALRDEKSDFGTHHYIDLGASILEPLQLDPDMLMPTFALQRNEAGRIASRSRRSAKKREPLHRGRPVSVDRRTG